MRKEKREEKEGRRKRREELPVYKPGVGWTLSWEWGWLSFGH